MARMVEEDRYCVDNLTQTAAVRSALKAVEKLLIEDQARHCVEDALASGDRDDQRAKLLEPIELLDKARGQGRATAGERGGAYSPTRSKVAPPPAVPPKAITS